MNDTAETTTETNTDGDDLPDYLDIDSDNDGIQDIVEGGDSDLDTNGDGVIDANDEDTKMLTETEWMTLLRLLRSQILMVTKPRLPGYRL